MPSEPPRRYDVYVRISDYDNGASVELADGAVVIDYDAGTRNPVGVEVLGAQVVEIDGVPLRPIINQVQARVFAAYMWDETNPSEWDALSSAEQGYYTRAIVKCARAAGIEVSDG